MENPPVDVFSAPVRRSHRPPGCKQLDRRRFAISICCLFLGAAKLRRRAWQASAYYADGPLLCFLQPRPINAEQRCRSHGIAAGPRAINKSTFKSRLPSQALGAPLPGGSSGEQPQVAANWPMILGLSALGIFISYADRSNISVAIISMTQEFHWSKTFEGWVLASFFAGYAGTQLLGGQLADKLGGKAVLATGLAVWSLATFVTPAVAAAGAAPLIAVRVLLGLGEGVAFPAVHSIISRL
ncbi:unnamed protein product, partial [Polarella glacialis]